MLLEGRYSNDPELLKYYKQNLLEPGWAGELNRAEFAYIKSQLLQSASLRRRWGFRPSARRLSEARIRDVAMYGILRSSKGVLASPRQSNGRDLMGRYQGDPKGWMIRYGIGPPRGV
jgi:hypothetical protein